MSRTSKIQKYAALWLSSQGHTVEDIAKELDLTEKQVSSVVQNTTKPNAIRTKTEPVGSSPSKNLMIRETANKKKHVAIMTKEASMVHDDAKNKNNQASTSQQNIFKINHNDKRTR